MGRRTRGGTDVFQGENEDTEPQTDSPIGDETGEEEDHRAWMTGAEASRRFRITRRQLEIARAKGEIRSVKFGGHVVYDPDGIAAIAPETPIVEQATALLRQSHAHQEQIMRMVTQSVTQFLQLQAEASRRLFQRVQELEDQRDAARAAINSAESQEHERALELLATEADQRRKDKALEILATHLPGIAARLSGKTSERDVSTFLKSLRPEQWGRISEVLDAGQLSALRLLLPAEKSESSDSASSERTVSTPSSD